MENREATNYRNTLRDELFASLDIHGRRKMKRKRRTTTETL